MYTATSHGGRSASLFPSLSSSLPVTPRGKKGAAGRRAGIGAPWVRQRVPGPLGASAPTPPRLLGVPASFLPPAPLVCWRLRGKSYSVSYESNCCMLFLILH